jgi:hypothetical protein
MSAEVVQPAHAGGASAAQETSSTSHNSGLFHRGKSVLRLSYLKVMVGDEIAYG